MVIALLALISAAVLTTEVEGPGGGETETIFGRLIRTGQRFISPGDALTTKTDRVQNRRTKKSESKRAKTASVDPRSSSTLHGYVANEDKQPLRNAEIQLRIADGKTKYSAKTDGGGRYRLAGVLDGTYAVRVTHETYPAIVNPAVTFNSHRSPFEMNFTLPLGAALKGEVVDEAGTPVPGVLIAAHRRKREQLAGGATYLDDAIYRTHGTNTSGKFEIQGLSLGENVFEFKSRGYASESRNLQIKPESKRSELKIVLRKTGRIAGIVATADGKPVPQATVQMTAYREPGAAVSAELKTSTTATNKDGEFQLTKLFNDGYYDLTIEHPEYAVAYFPSTSPGTEKLNCILERGGTIEGIAQYIDRPTSPAAVLLTAQAVIKGTTHTEQFRSSGDGLFSFTRLPFGRYNLYADESGVASEPQRPLDLSKTASVTTGVRVQVYETAVASGVVLDSENDAAIEDARIVVQSAYGVGNFRTRSFQTQSDASGNFVLPKLPAGNHTLLVTAKGYTRLASGGSAYNFMLLPGETKDDIELRLSHGAEVSGLVADAGGRPIPDADVQLFIASTSLRMIPMTNLHTKSDGSGRFVVPGIDAGPGIALFASARKPGYAKGRSGVIELSEQQQHAEVRVVLLQGGMITGKVVDANNLPVSRVELKFLSQEFQGDPSPSTLTGYSNPDGTYEIRNCTPGVGRVTATRSGYVQQSRNVTVINGRRHEKINFKLATGLKIEGRVATFEGKPLANARVTARPLAKAVGIDTAVTDKKGRFSLSNLGKGFFKLEAAVQLETPDGPQSYSFFLPQAASGGGSADIDCDLSGNLSGTVVGDDGETIDLLNITLRSRTDTRPQQDFRFNLLRPLKDTRGFFRVLSIPRGIYTLEIASPGFQTYKNEDIIVGPGKRTVLPKIRMRPAGNVVGTVINALSDRPVNNVFVRLLDQASPEMKPVTLREYPEVPRTEIVEGTYVDPLTIVDLQERNNPERIVAYRRSNISVSTRTDYAGRFNISAAPPGSYVLELHHQDFVPLRLPPVTVFEEHLTETGTSYITPGGAVQGVVLDDKGAPVVNAAIAVAGVTPAKTARTDLGGSFILRGLPQGTWRISAKGAVRGRMVTSVADVPVAAERTERVQFILVRK